MFNLAKEVLMSTLQLNVIDTIASQRTSRKISRFHNYLVIRNNCVIAPRCCLFSLSNPRR